MRALQLISLVAPLLARQTPPKMMRNYAVNIMSFIMMIFGGVFLLAALFVFTGKQLGFDIAFLVIAGIMFVPACIQYLRSLFKEKVTQEDTEQKEVVDPILQILPETVKANPTFVSIIGNIEEHPFGSTAAAAAIGYYLSQEIGD